MPDEQVDRHSEVLLLSQGKAVPPSLEFVRVFYLPSHEFSLACPCLLCKEVRDAAEAPLGSLQPPAHAASS